MMNDGTKGKPIPPGSCHVVDFDTRITVGHPPAPEFQPLGAASFSHLRVCFSPIAICKKKIDNEWIYKDYFFAFLQIFSSKPYKPL